MRRYETIIIVDPDLSDEGRAPILDRVMELIPQFNGAFIGVDDWGAKKLAYDIKKKTRGYYVRVDYCGNGALVSEIERFFRIDDRVLKFMTVLLDKDVDSEKILADLAQEKAAEAERMKATVQAEAPQEAKTEAEAPQEAKTEAKAPQEAKTEAEAPQEAKTEAEAPQETKTEAEAPQETKTEAEAADTPEPEETEETKATDSSEEA
ncbi:MAG: 30S ribosomal protein S6 [Deltaproteobacteria bacterium]|nr:30S ribosomal protein S6 [Deltaproteobacteria bacterium]